MAFEYNKGSSREVPPDGVHDAICVGVWDLGSQPVPAQYWKKKDVPEFSGRIVLAFGLRSGLLEFKEYSLNVFKGKQGLTKLAADLTTWMHPKNIFDKEGQPLVGPRDLLRLPGKHCQIKTSVNAKGYCDIESVWPAVDQTWETPYSLTTYVVGESSDYPADMPGYIIKRIADALASKDNQDQQRPASSGGGTPPEVPFSRAGDGLDC